MEVQLITAASGKFSYLLNSGDGILGIRAVLTDDGTHLPRIIEQTVGSIRLRDGDTASIMSNSTMSAVALSSTGDLITFSLEKTGTANISIPKDSIESLDLVGVSIDGKKGNYQVTETGDQYIFSLEDVKAGQTVSMSIGHSSSEDGLPFLVEMTLIIGACLGAFVLWRGIKKRRA
jgi:hypothetical protein